MCQVAAGENDDDEGGVDVTSLFNGWGCSIKFDDDIEGVVLVSDEDEDDDISSNVLDDLSRVVICFDLENEQPVARILDGA